MTLLYIKRALMCIAFGLLIYMCAMYAITDDSTYYERGIVGRLWTG